MKKLFRLIPIFCCLFFLTACDSKKKEPVVVAEKVEKPNIIFILTDDQRWDALGFQGNPIIKTPNMDELAGSGVYFKNAFVTTPICAASRATLFTGLYERTHDFNFGKPKLKDNYMYESYPYLLKKAGYRTGLVGKLGVKLNKGIEDSLFDTSKKTFWPYLVEVDGEERHLADINGDHAIDFIKSEKGKPFCLSLSFWSPHADDGAEEQYFWPKYVDSLYVNDTIPVPETADPKFFAALPEFMKHTMNRKRWYWRYDTPEKYQKMVKGYYKMISTVDGVIGRIRKTLEEEGLADNTVIVFMGDNGYYMGERGFSGKWLMHEQSLRVPLMIYDPREPKSAQSKTFDEMVLNLDIAPTLLDLAGVGIPESYQGESLVEFYNNDISNWRKSAFFEHQREGESLLPKTEAFRDDTYKFIRYEAAPEFIELYNLKEDFNEVNNLALDKKYSDLVDLYAKKCDSAVGKLMALRIKS
ncbi:sulfatase [Formosa undariae]|uniref:Sulfatase n=1 Tax=Formosa undariae TaxID=1325436 RepID=A0ABV5F6U1_9FLAO